MSVGILLNLFLRKDQLTTALNSNNNSKFDNKSELVLLFTNDDDEVKTTSDSLALKNELTRLWVESYIYRINSSEELLQFLSNHKYKYNWLSIVGHWTPLLVDVDQSNSNFKFLENSLIEDSINLDITPSYLWRNAEVFKQFWLLNLEKNSQITLFSCFAWRNFITYKEEKVKVEPIGQYIAEAFGKNTLCSKYSISTSWSQEEWNIVYPTYPSDFISLKNWNIIFLEKNAEKLTFPEWDTMIKSKVYKYNPNIHFVKETQVWNHFFIPSSKKWKTKVDTLPWSQWDFILFKPRHNLN